MKRHQDKGSFQSFSPKKNFPEIMRRGENFETKKVLCANWGANSRRIVSSSKEGSVVSECTSDLEWPCCMLYDLMTSKAVIRSSGTRAWTNESTQSFFRQRGLTHVPLVRPGSSSLRAAWTINVLYSVSEKVKVTMDEIKGNFFFSDDVIMTP